MKTFYIGSLPHTSVESAIQFVKTHSPELPFLPQLPGLNPQEDMIGQVLRGFEMGTWDDKASVCLANFWQEFSQSPRAKIQVAGPFAVARTMCMDFLEIMPQWITLFEGLVTQWESAKMKGEMWLQIDEPFWSKERPLPGAYPRFVGGLRKAFANLKIGIHSCATERPKIEAEIWPLFDFYSFDFSAHRMTAEEEAFWKKAPEKLVAGILSREKPPALKNVISEVQWISASCGLADWSETQLQSLAER